MFVKKPILTIFYPSNIGLLSLQKKKKSSIELLDLQVQAYKGLSLQQLWAIIDLKETV